MKKNKKPAQFHVYKAKDGYRWNLIARNGRIVAESGEAYTRENRCIDAIGSIYSRITDCGIKINQH